MRDFVEFNMNGDTVAIRPSYVISAETAENGATKLYIEIGDSYYERIITEPYREVVKKLKEAEEYDALPVVEHFTREEYGLLFEACEYLLENKLDNVHDKVQYRTILDKLEKLLKGEE